MTKFRKWAETVSQDEYEKLKPEVDEMLAAGKIK